MLLSFVFHVWYSRVASHQTAGSQHETNRMSVVGFEPMPQRVSKVSMQMHYILDYHG